MKYLLWDFDSLFWASMKIDDEKAPKYQKLIRHRDHRGHREIRVQKAKEKSKNLKKVF